MKELGQRNEQILALGYIASLHEDMEQYDSAIEFYTKVSAKIHSVSFENWKSLRKPTSISL